MLLSIPSQMFEFKHYIFYSKTLNHCCTKGLGIFLFLYIYYIAYYFTVIMYTYDITNKLIYIFLYVIIYLCSLFYRHRDIFQEKVSQGNFLNWILGRRGRVFFSLELSLIKFEEEQGFGIQKQFVIMKRERQTHLKFSLRIFPCSQFILYHEFYIIFSIV